MNTLLVTLSILSGVVLCGTAISLFVVYRAHCLLGEIKREKSRDGAREHSNVEAVRTSVDALAAQIHDLQSHPPAAVVPGLPKPGMNLNKRSQALRMHRRGEGAEQIASALELPRQEVELLIKVHRIVLSTV
ncbi:MAG: hypothetical protein ABI806_16260 [Candidatus Solibacter sp.]